MNNFMQCDKDRINQEIFSYEPTSTHCSVSSSHVLGFVLNEVLFIEMLLLLSYFLPPTVLFRDWTNLEVAWPFRVGDTSSSSFDRTKSGNFGVES